MQEEPLREHLSNLLHTSHSPLMPTRNTAIFYGVSHAYLFAHWFRVGDGRTEEAVPLQTAIETGPVIVTIAGVRQTPGNQCVELAIGWITGFAIGTGAHSAHSTSRAPAVLLVWVCVATAESETRRKGNKDLVYKSVPQYTLPKKILTKLR